MSINVSAALELADSVTGFDEMSVTQHFGTPLAELMDSDASMWGRALVFVIKRREGLNDDDARNAVLGMTIKEVAAHFEDDDEESGKDDSRPEPEPDEQPESSSSSAS